MDTKAPVLIVLSLGVAVAMFQASGAASILTAGPSDDLESGDKFRQDASERNVEETGQRGQVNPESDSDIVGVILGSVPQFFALLGIPGLLSAELMSFGLWSWAAIPLGLLANLITWVGGFQIATGRPWE